MATVKLGTLLIRTIAKPIATSIKNQAKEHPRFRDFCIGLAQTYHRVEMKMKMRFLDFKVETIRPLNDTRAVELGANFMSEGLLFAVAAMTIMGEAYRTSKANQTRRETLDDNISLLKQQVAQLKESQDLAINRMESVKEELNNLRQTLNTLQTKEPN